jgi:hypothetical protein
MRHRRNDGIGWGGAHHAVAGIIAVALVVGTASLAGASTASQRAQARKALLVLSDLPKGWTSTPSTNTGSGNFTGAPQLASCIGVPTQLIQNTPPQVDSPQFQTKSGSGNVQNTISIYPSAKYAQEEFAALSSKKTPGCITALLNAAGSGSGASGTTSVKRLASPKGTAAFAIDASVASQARSTPIHLELLYFIHGQLGDALDLTSVGSTPPSHSLAQHLLSVAQRRL